MQTILKLLAGKAGAWLLAGAAALLVSLSVGTTWWTTSTAYELKITRMERDAEKVKSAALERNADFIGDVIKAQFKIGWDFLGKNQKTITLTNTIIREVPSYVTPQTDAAFPVPMGLYRVWNGAILEQRPADIAPAGPGNDAAAPGIAASTLADNAAYNFGICHQYANQNEALKQEVTTLRDLWNEAAHPSTKKVDQK